MPGPPVQWQGRLQETVAAVLACLSELVRPSVEFLARSSDRPENAATRLGRRSAHSTRGGPGNVTMLQLNKQVIKWTL